MERKVFRDRYIIFMALDDASVENMLVLYAKENKLCHYPTNWFNEVITCFDRKFVEPRIVNVDKNVTYSYFDGKEINSLKIDFVQKDGHKKMEGKLLQHEKTEIQERA